MVPSIKGRVISIKADPLYWQELGKFVESFAVLEGTLFNVLAFYAGVPNDIARSLFSGTRGEAAISYIKRILEVKSATITARAQDLETIFTQFSAINGMRNKIIHYGTFVTSDKGRITSTALRALKQERVEEHRASTDILSAMTADIVLMVTALMWDLTPSTRPPVFPYDAPVLGNYVWQYIPERPVAQGKAGKGKKRG